MQSPLTEQSSVVPALPLKELGTVLVRHYGLHEGLYDVSFEIIMGGGRFSDEKGTPMPGAFVGIRQVGLVRVDKASENTVDASAVNPAAAAAKGSATRQRTKPKS